MTSTDLFDPLPFILTTIVAVVVSLYLILEDENSNTSMNEVEEHCNFGAMIYSNDDFHYIMEMQQQCM